MPRSDMMMVEVVIVTVVVVGSVEEGSPPCQPSFLKENRRLLTSFSFSFLFFMALF